MAVEKRNIGHEYGVSYLRRITLKEEKEAKIRADREDLMIKAAIGLGIGISCWVVSRGINGILRMMQDEAQDSQGNPLFRKNSY